MISKTDLILGLKEFTDKYLDKLGTSHPILSMIKPLATRAINNKIKSIHSFLDLIAEEDGTIDANGILTEFAEALMKNNPISIDLPVFGDVFVGGGRIELGIPFINKNIVFTDSDINYLKELLNSKNYGRSTTT